MPEFDRDSEKRLFQAIVDDDIDDIDKMVEEGYPVATAIFGESISTVLHIALSCKDVRLVTIKKLVELGSNLYAENSIGGIPLDRAVNNINADPAIVTYLMEQYGDGLSPEQARSALSLVLQTEYAYCHRDHMLKALGREDLIEDSEDEEDAYERASTYEEKVAIDPSRAAREYFERDKIKQLDKTIGDMNIDKTIGDMNILSLHDIITSPEAKEAINSLYNLYNKEKSDRLEYSVDEGIASIMADMFGVKKSDIAVDTKASILESLCDFLGIDFIQLGYLLNIAYASGFLPIYRGFPGNPDDEFDGHGPSGGAGIIFDNPNFVENEYIVTVLGNGTIVVAQDHSI